MGALGLLRQTGSAMSLVLNNFRVAQAVQSHEASLAAAWSAALQRAREVQRQAKASADRAVAEQRVLLLHVKAVALATSRAATRADATAARLKRELDAEIAAARARAAAAARAAVTARCRGGDISGYPNGQIPVDRLCPLYGAPGEELRRDAAATFNSMSRAFQRSFGVPLCLADSYRTYQRQQELYASEPAYAAYPGTSQHGWARAVDLCGGVQNDGTPQNSWMRTHAAQYNWFHPTWAEAGGGGPYEPWHWEFAG
jgi:hypothetical protein